MGGDLQRQAIFSGGPDNFPYAFRGADAFRPMQPEGRGGFGDFRGSFRLGTQVNDCT